MAVNSFSVEQTQQSAKTVVGDSPAMSVLLHELQLGEQLNESISQTRRADFALMLAMLAQDVREQSQFALPPSDKTKQVHQGSAQLRTFFELPDKAPLALKSNNEVGLFNQAEMVKEKGLARLHLTNAMLPRPLAFRDNAQHIPSNIMTNTSLYCQLRHSQLNSEIKDEQQDEKTNKKESGFSSQLLNKSLSFNAKEWLKGIEQSLVKAPLLA